MPMKIVGQCNQADFTNLESIITHIEDPKTFDVSSLPKSQEYAFKFYAMAMQKGISWNLMRKVVKEILFWNDDTKPGSRIDVKFKKNKNLTLTDDINKFRILWSTPTPKEKEVT